MLELERLISSAEDDLRRYVELTLKWSPKINLISKSTQSEIWSRHIFDSAQVFHVKQYWTGHHVDLGSGGGFPGLVISILAKTLGSDLVTTLIESDRRKSTFLQTVIRDLNLPAKVLTTRIETAPAQNADILTARALSDVTHLLEFADLHMANKGVALFPKGVAWQTDVESARRVWSFDLNPHVSATNPDSRILEIRRIQRV